VTKPGHFLRVARLAAAVNPEFLGKSGRNSAPNQRIAAPVAASKVDPSPQEGIVSSLLTCYCYE